MKRQPLSDVELQDRLSVFQQMKTYVDTLNAEEVEFGTTHLADLSPTPELKPFYALVGALLSPLTSEPQRKKALTQLIEHYKVLTPKTLSEAPEDILLELLTGCRFKEKKVKNIKACATLVHTKYHDTVPKDIATLKTFPGVGLKVANIICFAGYGLISALNVDERSLLLMRRLEWISAEESNLEKVRVDVEGWVPQDIWNCFPKVTILFAKKICKKVPLCEQCVLAQKMVCPFYCHKNGLFRRSLENEKMRVEIENLDENDELGFVIDGKEEKGEFLSGLDLVELGEIHSQQIENQSKNDASQDKN
ncbi:endonuclease III, putative [Entamoeba invadens IP1]|uniref:Endonuclease III, putative n=1 Tax=Entamoeba invadens IP1 TaxID=370355 RepID=A0A0A1UAL6_ENTIV|nr:endonuclease III, putative [Entamoeba invadens IP1]ELP92005.1 endonuclease III, putative [Entamoeba invadens IP1]|eukprot:XP_004258776.1 endonuclease III, putative [Entamoeba invadens IP1]